MNLNPPRRDWFFPIEEAPVLATVTRNGEARNVTVPNKKALVAADTGEIVGIVGAGYKVFTNQQAQPRPFPARLARALLALPGPPPGWV